VSSVVLLDLNQEGGNFSRSGIVIHDRKKKGVQAEVIALIDDVRKISQL
jgi:hypothetical protein